MCTTITQNGVCNVLFCILDVEKSFPALTNNTTAHLRISMTGAKNIYIYIFCDEAVADREQHQHYFYFVMSISILTNVAAAVRKKRGTRDCCAILGIITSRVISCMDWSV